MAFLTGAALITSVDSSVMVVTTPSIQKYFDAPLTSIEWTTSIYTLVYGATMLFLGKVGEIVTQRRAFIAGSVVFAAGSVLVGLAPSLELMVLMRVVQAVGAAMIMPSTIALIADLFAGRERPLAYGINGSAASVGVAAGYLAGGLAVQYADWRWAFFLNLAFCAWCVYGGFRYLPRTRAGQRPELDAVGAALSLVGLVSILFALVEGQTYGWWRARRQVTVPGTDVDLPLSVAALALLAGVGLLAWFTFVELRRKREGRTPLFDVTLFRKPSFRWSGIALFLRSVVQFAVFYTLTLYLQEVEGFSALTAGLAALPLALAGIVAAPLGARIAVRFGAQRSVLVGLTLQAAGIAWLWSAVTEQTTVWTVVLPNLVFGLGVGLSNAQLTVTLMEDVDQSENADTAAAATTLRQIGYATGAVTVGIVLSTTGTTLAVRGAGGAGAGLEGFRDNMALNLALTLVSIAVAMAIPDRRPKSALAGATWGGQAGVTTGDS